MQEQETTECADCAKPVGYCDTCDRWYHADRTSTCFLIQRPGCGCPEGDPTSHWPTLNHAKPLTTLEEAQSYVRALHAHGKGFHFEDDPAEVIKGKSEGYAPVFTPEEVPLIRERVADMYALPSWGEHECPIGYLLEVSGLNEDDSPVTHYRERVAELDSMCATLDGLIDGFTDAEDMDPLAQALAPIYQHLSQELSEARDDLANAQHEAGRNK